MPPATSTPTPSPTPTATPSVVGAPSDPTVTSAGPTLVITQIFFDGTGAREPDEFVVIRNVSGAAVNLAGWRLTDISENSARVFTFPGDIVGAGQEVRVYTNEVHPESGGYSFVFGNPYWNNCEPDIAGLFDPAGTLVSQATYARAPNCPRAASGRLGGRDTRY